MERYLVADCKGAPFELFGTAHLVFLACVVALCLAVVPLRRAGDRLKRGVRIGLGVLLMVNELAWHAWELVYGDRNLKHMLPLHLCSAFTWLGVIMLLRRSEAIFELACFLGVGGALQALLTPDLGVYGFPHFRWFQTFISHALVLVGPVYMAVVEGMRPRRRSLGRVLLYANLYMVPVYLVNRLVGSNYMYINAKPDTILDACGPWPWYVLAMVTISLLYIPYAVADLRHALRAGAAGQHRLADRGLPVAGYRHGKV
jgi:hypothetical integral membrane protein (TIGR02206 family)